MFAFFSQKCPKLKLSTFFFFFSFIFWIYIYLLPHKKDTTYETVSHITWVTTTHTKNNALTYLQYDYLRTNYAYNFVF